MKIRILSTPEQRILSGILKREIKEIAFDISSLSTPELKSFSKQIKKFKSGYPLDYITKTTNLENLTFSTPPGVLIPRPETLDIIKLIQSELKPEDTVFDLGCGTGLIGIFLAPFTKHIIASDISKKAIEVTRNNFISNDLSNFTLFQCDLLTNPKLVQLLKSTSNLILVCNPPYLPAEDKLFRKENRVEFEPARALYSGKDGLYHFKKIIEQILKQEVNIKRMYFELDPRNVRKAEQILIRKGFSTTVFKDNNGLDRILVAH